MNLGIESETIEFKKTTGELDKATTKYCKKILFYRN